ncbi:unnamed protein product [Nippostrongylus brasiliensis]|uniref:ANK_REP_REGION domain-containing protein n=1 Tax=Nippostrongylus brasiliensis TaxID=27835 RepID=A0A0N4Y012_NIPBR|nr:unnamed protein product [Nippostrongylus brasiliensis]
MCANEDANLCLYLLQAYDENVEVLVEAYELTSGSNVYKTLFKALEYLRLILEGYSGDKKSDLMEALNLELETHDAVTTLCSDAQKCEKLANHLAKSMENIIAALKEAVPEKKDDIEDIYNLVFGENGSRSSTFAEDMYYVVIDILNMLQEEQSV